MFIRISRRLQSLLIVTKSCVCIRLSSTEANALRPRKAKAHGNTKQEFVDWRRIRVLGGRGGDGTTSFLQLLCNPEAGPSGGDGGNGGHVIIQATKSMKTLGALDTENRGKNGNNGRSDDCTGKSADHTFLMVPTGTIVKNENGTVVADLNADGDTFLAARGGAGGKGNHFFLTNDNKEPLISEYGAEGENRTYMLELKTIAHAGLIGFPNAGKSTLLRAISRARPKVASYPFTTVKPHVGIVQYDDYDQIAVADIPGLIPGAHLNRGLGIAFLKHIERCLCLLFVIDLSVSEPWLQLDVLKNELEHYEAGLSSRPHVLIGNKLDLPESEDNLRELQIRVGDMKVIAISARTGLNVSSLLKHLREVYDTKQLKDQFDLN